MAKEIDLIMNPKAAPAELTAAVAAHQLTYTAWVKANTKLDEARAAQKAAQAAYDATAETYQKQLDAWKVK